MTAVLASAPVVIIVTLTTWTRLATAWFQNIVGAMPICYSLQRDNYAAWAVDLPVVCVGVAFILIEVLIYRILRRQGIPASRVFANVPLMLYGFAVPLCFVFAWIILGRLFYFSDMF